jgi:lysozyme
MQYSKEFRIRLKEEIISDEGCVLKVYRDHLGYFTIGVGHLILPSDEEWGVGEGTPITQTRADELLFYDLNTVLEECENHFHQNWSIWPEEVKLIIANMAFNLGITKLKKFQVMLTAINAEDYKTASKEGLNSKWAKQVHNRARRLMDRLRDIDVTDKFDSKGRLKK